VRQLNWKPVCFFNCFNFFNTSNSIIDLGRELPPMDEALHTSDRLVKGCQSNVWLEVRPQAGKLCFIVDSDAHIVRGLLALVMAVYNNKTADEISGFDIDGYFQQLDLHRHLSPTRGNGLRLIVAKIRTIAAAMLADKYLQKDD
jgi:cysteine desulfuration protein SufE